MSTTFRSTCMAILLFASISWDGCFGKIFLCSGRGGFSHNGTSVIAEIGQPASVTFCVDTDNHVHPYFKIQHTSVISDWFSNSTRGRVTTRIVKDGSKATITITINPVEETDLSDGFYVKVFAEPISSGGSLLLFFHLERKTGSEGNTENGETKQGSSSEGVGDGRTSTQPRCLPDVNSGCPEGWYPVADNRCIKLFSRIRGVYPSKQCEVLGGRVPEIIEITELKSCLQYLFENTTVKQVRSIGNTYNVLTGMKVNGKSDYMVACLVNKNKLGTTSQSTTPRTTGDLRPSTSTTVNSQFDTMTKGGHRCLPRISSGCPENMHPVDDHQCLSLVPQEATINSAQRCKKLGGQLAETGDITEIIPCLEYFLENTTARYVRFSSSPDIRLNATKAGRTSSSTTSHVMIACLIDTRPLVAPSIDEFYVETVDVSRKRKINLLIGLSAAKLDLTDRTLLTVVCRAIGNPSPELTLSRDNITLQDFNGSSLLIRKPDCSNSGVYTCHARNSHNFAKVQARIELHSPIKMNPITFTNRRTGNIWIQSGNDVAVNCSMTGCPYPDALTLANDANLTLSVYRKSFVIHEITRVQCSDMGTYYCRAEPEELEDRRGLLVEQCPLQLCRGQEKSVTIPMKLNQTTSVSVCLISDEMPTWENAHGSKDISVVFTQRSGSRIYFSAEISVSKTGDGHSDGFTIVMRNRHGSLDYLVKIQPVEYLGSPGESPDQSPSSEQTNLLPIVLPLVLALFMVFVVILLVVYRQNVKRYNETLSVLLNTMNSKENTNSEIEQGRYENIQGVETSVKLMPAVSEEEDETKTYCVILEY